MKRETWRFLREVGSTSVTESRLRTKHVSYPHNTGVSVMPLCHIMMNDTQYLARSPEVLKIDSRWCHNIC